MVNLYVVKAITLLFLVAIVIGCVKDDNYLSPVKLYAGKAYIVTPTMAGGYIVFSGQNTFPDEIKEINYIDCNGQLLFKDEISFAEDTSLTKYNVTGVDKIGLTECSDGGFAICYGARKKYNTGAIYRLIIVYKYTPTGTSYSKSRYEYFAVEPGSITDTTANAQFTVTPFCTKVFESSPNVYTIFYDNAGNRTTAGNDVTVLQVDMNNSTTVWEYTSALTPTGNYTADMEKMGNGEFILFTSLQPSNFHTPSDIVVIRLSTLGRVLWESTLANAEKIYLSNINELTNGTIVLVGNINISVSKRTIKYMSFDRNGQNYNISGQDTVMGNLFRNAVAVNGDDEIGMVLTFSNKSAGLSTVTQDVMLYSCPVPCRTSKGTNNVITLEWVYDDYEIVYLNATPDGGYLLLIKQKLVSTNNFMLVSIDKHGKFR